MLSKLWDALAIAIAEPTPMEVADSSRSASSAKGTKGEKKKKEEVPGCDALHLEILCEHSSAFQAKSDGYGLCLVFAFLMDGNALARQTVCSAALEAPTLSTLMRAITDATGGGTRLCACASRVLSITSGYRARAEHAKEPDWLCPLLLSVDAALQVRPPKGKAKLEVRAWVWRSSLPAFACVLAVRSPCLLRLVDGRV